jgi:hypothetical protein
VSLGGTAGKGCVGKAELCGGGGSFEVVGEGMFLHSQRTDRQGALVVE